MVFNSHQEKENSTFSSVCYLFALKNNSLCLCELSHPFWSNQHISFLLSSSSRSDTQKQMNTSSNNETENVHASQLNTDNPHDVTVQIGDGTVGVEGLFLHMTSCQSSSLLTIRTSHPSVSRPLLWKGDRGTKSQQISCVFSLSDYIMSKRQFLGINRTTTVL